jgi:predicted NBD/HSP70 family sugar kinase
VGAAGDIGHIRGPGLDDLCVCGMRGCVEAKGGGWALARDLRALGHDAKDSWDVVGLLRAREPDAVRLVGEAGRVIGHAIADAVSFFNPSHVVLGGEIAHAHEGLLATVREVVYSRSLPLATRSLRIDLSELGERAGVIGAAYRGIEHRLGVDAVDRELERRLASGSLAAWT